jgi:hypothetical protein
LLVANYVSNSMSLLFGNGDGTFKAPKNFVVPDLPIWVAVGDFNGDGLLDFVETSTGTYWNGWGTELGNGDGTFLGGDFYHSGGTAGAGQVALGDFNRDGKVDLAMVYSKTDSMRVMLSRL